MEVSILNGYKIKDKKAIRFYDTVQDMKEDDTLKEGMHVKTSGYTTIHDGGAEEYKITNEVLTPDNDSIIALSNNLFAKKIVNKFYKIYENQTFKNRTFNNEYIFLDKCNIDHCIFTNCTITGECTNISDYGIILEDNCVVYNLKVNNYNKTVTNNGLLLRGKNIKVENSKFDSFYNAIICSGRNLSINHCSFTDSDIEETHTCNIKVTKTPTAVQTETSYPYPEDINIENCNFAYCTDNNIDLFTGGKDIRISNCLFDNSTTQYIEGKSYSYERDQGYNTDEDFDENVTIENCVFKADSYKTFISFVKHIDTIPTSENIYGIGNIKIINNIFDNGNIIINSCEHVYIANNLFKQTGDNYSISLNDSNNFISARNNVIIEKNKSYGGRFINSSKYIIELNYNYMTSSIIPINFGNYKTLIKTKGNIIIGLQAIQGISGTWLSENDTLITTGGNATSFSNDSYINLKNLIYYPDTAGRFIINGVNKIIKGNIDYLYSDTKVPSVSINLDASSSVTNTSNIIEMETDLLRNTL